MQSQYEKQDVLEILYQQMKLLAEDREKTLDIETKIRISAEIDRIAETILSNGES